MTFKIIIAGIILLTSFTSSAQKDNTFPLVVSFVSHCCGVPDRSAVVDYVACFKKNCTSKLITAYKVGPVGKEGEYYLAFPLSELSKSQAKKFIEGMEKVMIKEGDKGALIIEKDFTIDSNQFEKAMSNQENILKL